MLGMEQMLVKMISPQLKKLGGVIQALEKTHGVEGVVLMMKNDIDATGKVSPVLILAHSTPNGLSIIKNKEGEDQRFSIEKLGEIIAGGISE